MLHASVPATAVAGLPITGALRFHTNDPNEPVVTIPLSVTPRGATLIMPSSPVDFGDIPVSATSPSVVGSILNVGNAPAEVVVGAPSDPQFAAQTKSLFVLPGSKEDVAMTFSPKAWATVNASLPVTVKGPVCGALPTMPLRGKGTKGVVLTSPGSLDFGLVDCGATAGPKKVTVANQGDAAFDVDAVLAVGTSFTVAPAKATVPAGGSIELVVTPSAIPQTSAVTPDLYGDTLTLTTNALGDFPHVVALHETARGAILSLTLPSTPIRSRVDDVKLVPVTLTNTGNAGGMASLTTPNNALRITGAGVPAGATTTPNLEVRADPEKLGVDDLEPLTWSTTPPTCGTNVVSGTVHAYDSAIDASVAGNDQCVIGHTHRLYCWGPNAGFRLPFQAGPDYSKPTLYVGDTADGVLLIEATEIRTGSVIKRVSYQGSTKLIFTKTLPPTFASVMYSSPSSTNQHWCALTAQGDLSCVGYSVGAWANGAPCGQTSTTPVPAFPSVRPIQAYASDDFYSQVISNGEIWLNPSPPCSLGPPTKLAGISDATRLSAAGWQACAVRVGGTVSCWKRDPLTSPQPVTGITDAIDILVDPDLSCVIRANGAVRCWGYQLGSPTDVAGMAGATRLVGSFGKVCAINGSGILACTFGAPFQPILGFEGP